MRLRLTEPHFLERLIETTYQNLGEADEEEGDSDVDDDADDAGEQQVDLREMEQRFLSDRLTGPLTLLYVAQLCKLSKGVSISHRKELVIHIAGSNTVEMLGIIKWEY